MEVIIPDNLEELKRNRLQSLCKSLKIPANLKNVELIRRLKEIRERQLSNQVVSNENDAQSDAALVASSTTDENRSGGEVLSNDDQMLCNDNSVVVDDDVILHHDPGVTMVTANADTDDDENTNDTKKKGTSNRRRRRVGHSRRQKKRGRKTKATTNNNDDVMMDDDHVINQCPEGANTGNHGDSHTSNPPPAVFTPAKEIINEDNMISSSARRRRKYWSEVQHNESIEELFDRMASSSAANTAPVVDMDTINNDDDDDDDDDDDRIVTGVVEDEGQNGGNDHVISEHDRVQTKDDIQEYTQDNDDDQPPRKRRRRSTFDVETSTITTADNVIDDDNSSTVAVVHNDNNNITTHSPDSNRSSLSNQFMKQKKHKPVAVGNNSQFTEQSLSPLVTNSQTASLGVTVDDDDEEEEENKIKKEMTAMLEDRVKLRKSQCTGGNAKERGGASTAGRKRKLTHSVTTCNSKIPVANSTVKKMMTAADFDKIHQKNFDRSQSIVDYNNRRQQHLSSVTPLGNTSSINKNNTTSVKCSGGGYLKAAIHPRLNQTVSSSVGGVFRFNATSSTKDSNKKHRETAERRKSYNAQSSAKKKPRTYKPYTGKLPPMPPINNY